MWICVAVAPTYFVWFSFCRVLSAMTLVLAWILVVSWISQYQLYIVERRNWYAIIKIHYNVITFHISKQGLFRFGANQRWTQTTFNNTMIRRRSYESYCFCFHFADIANRFFTINMNSHSKTMCLIFDHCRLKQTSCNFFGRINFDTLAYIDFENIHSDCSPENPEFGYNVTIEWVKMKRWFFLAKYRQSILNLKWM